MNNRNQPPLPNADQDNETRDALRTEPNDASVTKTGNAESSAAATTANAGLPRTTPARKFDPSQLRLPDSYLVDLGGETRVLEVPIRKPRKHEWLQVHPDESWRLQAATLIDSEDRNAYYVIDPRILPSVALEAVPTLLVTAVNTQPSAFLLPIPLPGRDGRHNPWHRSLMEAAQLGMVGQWIRIVANQSAGAYDVRVAPGNLGLPSWPNGTFSDLLRTALRDRLIDSLDHPILRRLRGEL